MDAMVLHGTVHTGFMKEIFFHLSDFLGGMSFEDFLKFITPVAADALMVLGKIV